MMLPHAVPRRSSNVPPKIRIWLIVVLAAVPSFFLGTTLSILSGIERCSDHGQGNDHPIKSVVLESRVEQRLEEVKKQHEQEIRELQRKVDSCRESPQSGDVNARVKAQVKVLEHKLNAKKEKEIERRVREQLALISKDLDKNESIYREIGNQENDQQQQLFPKYRTGRFVSGMALTSKADFAETLEMGVPVDKPEPGAMDVLILYSRNGSMPNSMQTSWGGANSGRGGGPLPNFPMSQAVENCNVLNIILTDFEFTKVHQQCIAIVPQYESYHIQKWMRVNTNTNLMDHSQPLQLVSRGKLSDRPRNEFEPPYIEHTVEYWAVLKTFLAALDDIKTELRPILERIAIANTVVVMVCNFGQSELLINFVCAARFRKIDISNIIVFSTDQETTDLVESLGLTAYYDHRNFADMPSEAAGKYGDPRFVAMMLAKVICVELVSLLGFNFLFQDVDIVWFKNPLQYFQDEKSPAHSYDVFFQDDGGHTTRFAPYAANTGFYFIRNNNRTRHFLNSLFLAGDLILKTDSHQAALIAFLAEHVSLYGLRAKVLSVHTDEFPGGYHFHQFSGKYMRSFFGGLVHPYIFHMSWTWNKKYKLKFFQQIGEWFVHDQCIEKKVADIPGANPHDIRGACCSTEPIVKCYYRDKPSKTPCPDSPNIDKGRKSFW